ncbi:MAG TPA: LysE family transporter [Paludibacteraceae bacterium]|jgi:threonine/homoserine/homoserine lactone efflux protein|nr:LysE family transporter [Paludibacteraceae bacterium]
MLKIILKGIIIGWFISGPIGPIGMLVIQRTMNRGVKYGIATGVGATFSDLIYTVITLFCLNFVIGFIEKNQLIIELIGSIIVIFFGYFIFKSNPALQPKPNEPAHDNLFKDFISSFVLTFSNPLIIFVLIALFARLNFITRATNSFLILCGFLSIFAGAMIWWLALTFLVSHFRSKVSIHQLKAVNQITGSIIMLIGLVGTVVSFLK